MGRLPKESSRIARKASTSFTPFRGPARLPSQHTPRKSAFFKDVKAWKAEPDPRWPQKRARLFALLKKKPAALGYK